MLVSTKYLGIRLLTSKITHSHDLSSLADGHGTVGAYLGLDEGRLTVIEGSVQVASWPLANFPGNYLSQLPDNVQSELSG